MEEIIEVENLCFEYEPGLQTISNISFQIHKGEYVAILGHNGSGKSTIAKLLIGLLGKKIWWNLYRWLSIKFRKFI